MHLDGYEGESFAISTLLVSYVTLCDTTGTGIHPAETNTTYPPSKLDAMEATCTLLQPTRGDRASKPDLDPLIIAMIHVF
eukprot:Nitzschia sp. Nitz4//scaffold193_size40683//7638//7909//NITZ4_007495-RA/size40683-snap-gene-0.51-mRNA-1//1//CDS//3329540267//2091//frame0